MKTLGFLTEIGRHNHSKFLVTILLPKNDEADFFIVDHQPSTSISTNLVNQKVSPMMVGNMLISMSPIENKRMQPSNGHINSTVPKRVQPNDLKNRDQNPI